jgi:hypothetical protein
MVSYQVLAKINKLFKAGKNQVVGISYRCDEVSFKGSQLGRNYSAAATLQRFGRGVAIRDNISISGQRSVDAVQLRNQLLEDNEIMAEQYFFEDIAVDSKNGIIDEEG